MALKGKDDAAKIYNFLMEKLNNENGVFGLMGNLQAESGLKSNNLQNSFNQKLNISDEDYTLLVNNNGYPNFVKDSAGYGLAQWTYYTRKQKLYDYLIKTKKVSIDDLEGQLEFLYIEMTTSYSTVWKALQNAKSIKEASNVVLTQFEKPKNQSDSVKKTRAGYGEKLQKQYGKGTTTATSSGTTKTALKFKNNDIVAFNGRWHYTSANGDTGSVCKSGVAKVTHTSAVSKHAYHLEALKGMGSTVFGWVNADDVTMIKKILKVDLHLREGYGKSYKSLGIMKANSNVLILEQDTITKWFKVYSFGLKKVGYCSYDYFK